MPEYANSPAGCSFPIPAPASDAGRAFAGPSRAAIPRGRARSFPFSALRAALLAAIAALAFCAFAPSARAGITIGQGPEIGRDHDYPVNIFYEEFQDWKATDLRALDPASGADSIYKFNDGFDDSRDLVAFYSRIENGNLFMRADFYDLAMGAENGNLDLYVAIDCAAGGQSYMPDFTNVSVDPSHNWELCLALYRGGSASGSDYKLYKSDWSLASQGILGSYWNSQLDAVEFGIPLQALYDAGWNQGTNPVLYFTVMTTAERETQANKSKATDTFFDADRGWADGVINGAIASNSTAGKAKWATIAHGNQSINKNSDTRIHIFDPTNSFKTGFIRTLDTHEIFNVPINLHLSGSLIIACRWAVANPQGDPATAETPLSDGPAFLQRVGQFVDSDQTKTPGALVGGVLAEHIMPYYEGPVNELSLNLFDEVIQREWGLTAKDIEVMHVPERVIRSQPTNISPLDGLTFQNIKNTEYKATYLDEITHYHWWFDSSNTTWTGYPRGSGAADVSVNEHKIHKINGVYCFLINDREDQAKFGNQDGGAILDTRYTLLEKARHADQAQLTLVFDDWEALAGKSFDPVQGVSNANNNERQYQNTVRWLANHPWIEIVTMQEILHRATLGPGSPNPHPQYDAAWAVDHGIQNNLSTQTYEWLKHATELSYHNWYYNENAGYAGNEQNFFNLVPVLSGAQGDYFTRNRRGEIGSRPTSDAQANQIDAAAGAIFLPNGKKHGDLNTPGTLMRDAWDAIASAPVNDARRAGQYVYCNMIYETAWHEEDQNDYYNSAYQNPFPSGDSSWDGVNTWALKLQNHVRKAWVFAKAAQWAEDVSQGEVSSAQVIQSADLDDDGENEFVVSNNRIWCAFEPFGGRCIQAFAYDAQKGQPISVLGVLPANPPAPGEEEYTGTSTTRCSAFKEMNWVGSRALCDQKYSAEISGRGARFSIPSKQYSYHEKVFD